MNETFEQLQLADLDECIQIIKNRIEWMNQVGLQQWNVTKYLEVYPRSYFKSLIQTGKFYSLKSSEGRLFGSAALLTEDERWEKFGTEPAYYIHHLTTSLSARGAGERMLAFIENKANKEGRKVRLDCAIDNAVLNTYYEKLGYQQVGSCIDGLYVGNLREKAG